MVLAKGATAANTGELALDGNDNSEVMMTRVETPAEITSALANIPSSCANLCQPVSRQKATAPGKYGSAGFGPDVNGGACVRPPRPAHVTHWKSAGAGLPHPLMFTPEELRASVRSGDVLLQRVAINRILFFGETNVVRGDWRYDATQSPEANWHRRKAYETRDFQGQTAEEGQRDAQARRLLPALRRAVQKDGGSWERGEIPEPPEGSTL
jgi:hypothetical protein